MLQIGTDATNNALAAMANGYVELSRDMLESIFEFLHLVFMTLRQGFVCDAIVLSEDSESRCNLESRKRIKKFSGSFRAPSGRVHDYDCGIERIVVVQVQNPKLMESPNVTKLLSRIVINGFKILYISSDNFTSRKLERSQPLGAKVSIDFLDEMLQDSKDKKFFAGIGYKGPCVAKNKQFLPKNETEFLELLDIADHAFPSTSSSHDSWNTCNYWKNY